MFDILISFLLYNDFKFTCEYIYVMTQLCYLNSVFHYFYDKFYVEWNVTLQYLQNDYNSVKSLTCLTRNSHCYNERY